MYPTKEEILKEPRPRFKSGVMKTISEWKKNFYYPEWGKRDTDQKIEDLNALAIMISVLYGRPDPTVLQGEIIRYEPIGWRIYLAEEPSIVSLFHELAHHLFGPDELTACRWSVWLYQLRFRNDYNKLVWKGHLLVKPGSKDSRRVRVNPKRK